MVKKKRVLWGRVFAFLGILLMVFVVVLFSTNLIPSTTLIRSILAPKAAVGPKPINVLEIRYMPYNQATQRTKTDALSSGLVAAMSEASKYRGYKNTAATPYSQVVIKRVIERDVNAPNTPGTHELWYDSLNTILTGTGENLCDYIVANNIDQVWGWFDVANDTNGGFNQEFARFYSSALLPQDPYGAMCGGRRSFIFLGLDQGAPLGNALHSFGHSMESLMSKVEGDDLFWSKWAGITGAQGGIAHTCGDVHFPPNGQSDYDYTRTTNISTTCEDWKPDGPGTSTVLNCSRWGCSQEGYMKWWLQSAPNANNGLVYQGRALPNWWDLLSDTDNAIGTAAYNGQYMTTQFLDASRPPNFDFSSKKQQDTGVSMTFSHPTNGTNRLMLIAASYISQGSAATDGGGVTGARLEQVSNITVGSTTLTAASNRIRRTINGQYVSELWYMVNPPVGTNAVTVNFTNTFVNNENVSITTLTGVNQTTPFATNVGVGATGTSTTPTISIPSTTSQMLFGVTSMYTGSNTLTVSGSTRGIAATTSTNVIGKSAVAVGGPTASLSWSGTNTWPWAISAATINLVSAQPTITPSPTLTPTALPTPTATPAQTVPVRPVVDIKLNGLDRVYGNGGGPKGAPTGRTLTWTTTGATSCVGLGGWTGAKALNGSLALAVPVTPPTAPSATYYALQCKNAAGVTWYDIVWLDYPLTNGIQVTREGGLFINGFDSTPTPVGSGIIGAGIQQTLYVPKGTAPKLTWALFNETCTPSWATTMPTVQPAVVPAITAGKTYSLSCAHMYAATVNTY